MNAIIILKSGNERNAFLLFPLPSTNALPFKVSGPQNNHQDSEEADAHAETSTNAADTTEILQDDEENEDEEEDEQDVEYGEEDSNNNPDGDNDDTDAPPINHRSGDHSARNMPNDNVADATTPTHNARTMDDGHNGGENHASSSHHMKHSPSDEEFYGPTAGNTNTHSDRNRCPMRQYGISYNEFCPFLFLVVLVCFIHSHSIRSVLRFAMTKNKHQFLLLD